MKKILLVIALFAPLTCSAQIIFEKVPQHPPSKAVQITMYFTPREEQMLGYAGKQSTGWFCGSSKRLVTIAHAVTTPDYSETEWRQVKLSYCAQDNEAVILDKIVDVRLHSIIECPGEGIAVLELKNPLFEVQPLVVRTDQLEKNMAVTCSTLTDRKFVRADGTFHRMADMDKFADMQFRGFGLFELQKENDRLILDHGASGAPILDDNGEVVAVVSSVITQTLTMPFCEPMRISTSWGTPNIAATTIPPILIELGGKKK